MKFSYEARALQSGAVELISRNYDGVETNVDILGRFTPDEAEAFCSEILKAAAVARENERAFLDRQREKLVIDAESIRAQLDQVTSKIAEIDAKRDKLAPSPELAVNGSQVVLA